MTILFGRVQEAIDTPFEPNRNPQWGGNVGPSGIDSIETQSAIEEVYGKALANDRFIILASYGGNANTGRYLDFFSSSSSDVSPLYLSVSANLLSVTYQTSSAQSTCAISFFNLTVSSTVPVYTLSMTNAKRAQATGTPLASFPAGSNVAIRVTSGSLNTPTLQFTFSASTG
jgi:hypothetical protein